MKVLDPITYDRVKELCAQGDEAVLSGHPAWALELYRMAWDQLPKPSEQWEAAMWILTAIGDVNYQAGNFEEGRNNFSAALHCSGGLGNPYLHLRLGQCVYQLGEHEAAADDLSLAFLGGGAEIFAGEAPEYLVCVQTRINRLISSRRSQP